MKENRALTKLDKLINCIEIFTMSSSEIIGRLKEIKNLLGYEMPEYTDWKKYYGKIFNLSGGDCYKSDHIKVFKNNEEHMRLGHPDFKDFKLIKEIDLEWPDEINKITLAEKINEIIKITNLPNKNGK